MRTLKTVVALVSFSAFLFSCNKEDNKVTYTNEYLPLEVGNYWQMEFMEKKEIVGTREINHKTYYMLRCMDDTSFYRIENDKVYVREYEGGPSLKFNLSAEVNDTWNYNLYDVRMVSKTDTITINNQKIYNCYGFYFDVPEMVDEEHMIWLAPGIGFVQEACGECIHPLRRLDQAKIGDQVIDY